MKPKHQKEIDAFLAKREAEKQADNGPQWAALREAAETLLAK